MNKFYVRATDGAVPSVEFEFLNYWKIKIYTDETSHDHPSASGRIFFRLADVLRTGGCSAGQQTGCSEKEDIMLIGRRTVGRRQIFN